MNWGSAPFQKFSKWMFASMCLSSCQNVLSMDAMLELLAVLNETRTLNYIGKDVVGQLSSLLVMLGFSKHIDLQPRQFMVHSVLLHQTSMALTLVSPLFPTYFVAVAGVGSMLGNVAFMGLGAINAKCIQTLATENNVGELYSKLTITQTLAGSVGMAAGVAVLPEVTSWNYAAFAALGIGHMFCYHRAVTSVLK